MEDASRPAPQSGLKNVDRSEEAGYMLRLFNDEEGYHPMDGFYDALNDEDKVTMATR